MTSLCSESSSFLSGEICAHVSVSRACSKAEAAVATVVVATEVSRGRSTDSSHSNDDGKGQPMKNKEELPHDLGSSATQQTARLRVDEAGVSRCSRNSSAGDQPDRRPCGQTALSISSETLMEQIVDPANMQRAWQKSKANRGAPGPDGITIDRVRGLVSPNTGRAVRQQLLDGTYQPSPARRKTIPKPDGGERQLGIPNVLRTD